jgi:hypothetical protein
MFDRRPDRAPRISGVLVLPKVGIRLVELPHLAVGSPTQVAGSGLAQIGVGDRFSKPRAA